MADVNRYDELPVDPADPNAPEGNLPQETIPPGPDPLSTLAGVQTVELTRQAIQPQFAVFEFVPTSITRKLELDQRTRHLLIKNSQTPGNPGGGDVLFCFAQPNATPYRLGFHETISFDDLFLPSSLVFFFVAAPGTDFANAILAWW